MCGGDDHLAWKHPVFLEACRGLRTAGGEGIRLSIFGLCFYAFDSYRVTFEYTLSSVSIFVGVYVTDLDSPLWIRVGGRLTRVSDQSDQRSDQRDMDSHSYR
ncbi:hypothetical protein CK203_031967 [Vitis vinifera]|uniref:Uncharacterized protein n=1 Tax=Vitis vinifera TaxID=29760 RepID=A0A438FN65_VITVI|nr:hypothetical protein CK203_031967 [Vitis vinifera]